MEDLGERLTPETVRTIARLARLPLAEAEVASVCTELGRFLEFVAALDAVDTTGVEPTGFAAEGVNRFRPDALRDALTPADRARNAPVMEDGAFVVPRVLG